MDLEQLRSLPTSDQQVFLLGRIAAETTRMDAALRLLHAALRGERDVPAILDAPKFISTASKECRTLLKAHPDLGDATRTAVAGALTATDKAYKLRNRYFHDLLRSSILVDGWELAPLTREGVVAPDLVPDALPVSFDDMVQLVQDLVTATWRLRGCGIYLLTGGWSGLALGHVDGDWEGNASYVQ